ncbi:hypothetical protein [Acinetobacter courvalinii]|nr:hypothetical protein [Acinetobacter courvalinii]
MRKIVAQADCMPAALHAFFQLKTITASYLGSYFFRFN